MKKYIAHAGIHLGSTAATQNSLRSVNLAAAAGFDYCELDIHFTSDGIPVAIHNRSLNETYRKIKDYAKPEEEIYVGEHTLAKLRENYIGRSVHPEHREGIPTLEECLVLAKKLEIIPMIHPKLVDAASVNAVMDVCDAVMGAGNYVIVAENTACEHAVGRDPNQPIMPVITDMSGIDYWSSFPNSIIAIRSSPDYEALVSYAHKMKHPVETTLNRDIRAHLLADVINYDYLSPGRFELYENITEYSLPAQDLKKGDILTLTDNRTVSYGTAELCFTLCGEAELTVCSQKYSIEASEPTEYRAPVLIFEKKADVVLIAVSDTKIIDMRLRVGEHPVA